MRRIFKKLLPVLFAFDCAVGNRYGDE